MTQLQRTAGAGRLEASLAPAELADVRLVARRLRGETITAIADDLGRPASYVAARSQKAAAQLALTVEPDVAQVLRELSWAGQTAQQLARRVPAGRSLVQLIVNEGVWPEPANHPTLRAIWLAGGTWGDLAAEAGRSQAWVRARVRGLGLPPRLSRADVARRLGVPRCAVTTFGVSKVLPSPDGRWGNGRPWWWPPTIDQWSTRALHECPVCGARMVGLAQHQRRAHGQRG